jgi:UDP-N-acetyl-2-amino-2-deoxyglucuronate dehydrogenase
MLQEIEIKAGKKVFSILQLRLHPVIKEMKKSLNLTKKRHFVELNYITPRGKWYDYSWKGDFDKSGGVLFNIGIHFFDMLIWIFGRPISHNVDLGAKSAEGILKLEKADVKFKLSIDHDDLPYNDWLPMRSLTIDKKEFNFSEGFTDLHNESYKEIINGNGFNLEETLPAIDLVEQIINK